MVEADSNRVREITALMVPSDRLRMATFITVMVSV